MSPQWDAGMGLGVLVRVIVASMRRSRRASWAATDRKSPRSSDCALNCAFVTDGTRLEGD
jgi:hypothetical protein